MTTNPIGPDTAGDEPRQYHSVPASGQFRDDSATAWRDEYIRQIVAAIPPLTQEQLDRIAVLLRPAVSGAGRSTAP